tara:strand:- start:763 stop:996 length:234 start_codon:yes stop_codon:yes gene_type:complete
LVVFTHFKKYEKTIFKSFTKLSKIMNFKIQNYVISVEWNDNPKLETLHHDMPDGLRQDFDDWLSTIEHERNTVEGGN